MILQTGVSITIVVLICAFVFIASRYHHIQQLRSIAELLRARSREFDAAAIQNEAASNKAFFLAKLTRTAALTWSLCVGPGIRAHPKTCR